ncbi:MAG: MFS transporter [Thermomicrobiales bacterium]
MRILGAATRGASQREGRGGVPLNAERRRILVWMCVLIAVNQLGFGAIVPVIPLYAEEYGVSKTAVGLTIAIYGLARFLLNVPAGQIADRRGRRWTLALGGVVSVVGNLACAAAPDFATFLVARFVAGAGASMVLLGGTIVLADIASPENRGRVMGIYQGVFLFAVGFGPIPGGLLASYFGLTAPFVGYAVLAAVVAFLAWYRVPETRWLRDASRAVPPPHQHATAPWRAQMAVLAHTPGFLAIGIVSFVSFFGRTGALFNVIPIHAENDLGLAPDAIGLGLGIISIVSLVMAYPSGMLVDHFGRKAVIVPSLVVTGVSMSAFAIAGGFGGFFLACLLWSIASGMSGAAPAAYAADVAPPGMNAAAMSNYRLIADLGYVAGPLLLGLATDLWSAETALAITAALAIVAGLGFARFAPESLPSRQPSAVSRQLAVVDDPVLQQEANRLQTEAGPHARGPASEKLTADG